MMKSKLAGIALAFSFLAKGALAATEAKTYSIVVRDDADVVECSKSIHALKGAHVIRTLKITGFISAKLTERARENVEKLPCVASIEEDITVGPQPAIGGSN